MRGLKFYLVGFTVVQFCQIVVQGKTLCLSGDFDEQLHQILDQQMYHDNPADIIVPVLGDVETTLHRRWQGFELIPFGSSTTGLGTQTSDVDLSLRLQNLNSASVPHVLQEAEDLFMSQPGLYSDVNIKPNPRYPRLSFFHIPSQREVDLIFRYGDGAVYDSKLLKYFFNLDERILPLARFLKIWFKVHGSTGHESGTLPSYGLCLMLIFYLQQKDMVPPGYVLQVESKSYFFKTWDLGFNELPYKSTNTETLHQLLGGFFKYYSEFDFDKYIVSPYTGRPIPRNAFIDIDKFPKEYTLNNCTLERLTTIQNDLKLNTAVLHIQDIFEHDSNKAKRVTHEYANKYKSLFKSAAAMFEDLPSDRILRAILVTDQLKESFINDNNAILNEINKENCIKLNTSPD